MFAFSALTLLMFIEGLNCHLVSKGYTGSLKGFPSYSLWEPGLTYGVHDKLATKANV